MMLHKFLNRGFGIRKVFHTPQEFLAAAIEYFEWVDEHPLQQEELFAYQGTVTRADVNKMRAYTKNGLAIFIGMPVSRLDNYKQRKEEGWAEAVEMIETIIHEQKFTGAAAGLLNAALITRDLGLAEKQELSGPGGEPLQQVVQYQLPSNGRD